MTATADAIHANRPHAPDAPTLTVKDLKVAGAGREIPHGLDVHIRRGEGHAILVPTGSGKSTLAYALMGSPRYEVTGGEVTFKGEDLLAMATDERARAGLFLCFQYPTSIPGVIMGSFIRLAVKQRFGDASVKTFRKELEDKLRLLKMDRSYMERYLNEGFSGGEKKKAEILQMAMLKP